MYNYMLYNLSPYCQLFSAQEVQFREAVLFALKAKKGHFFKFKKFIGATSAKNKISLKTKQKNDFKKCLRQTALRNALSCIGLMDFFSVS